MFNDYVLLRMGKEKVNELLKEAEEARMANSIRRQRPAPVRIGRLMAATRAVLVAIVLGRGI